MDNKGKTMEIMWNEIKDMLQNQLSEPIYQTFLSSTNPMSFSNHVLALEVPNQFSKNWVKEKCEPLIHHYYVTKKDTPIVIQYAIAEKNNNEPEQLEIFTPTETPQQQNAFNPKYTFENFIVGHNNRFAHAACEAVSKAPALAYNPLFIYGSVGLGKTHLLHAIGLEISKKHPSLKVKLVSSEKFTNDLINIKDKRVESFRSRYRHVDVLILDDIQFLSGKTQTQEELFHTFNDLHGNNKQIILASDRPPKEIPTLEIRLRTRFEWGLIADMQPPEFETRIAFYERKSE